MASTRSLTRPPIRPSECPLLTSGFQVSSLFGSDNNAIACKGSETNTTVETSPVLNFYYFADPSLDPTLESNVPAAITNAFYVVNAFHDFAYLYGCTVTTFNFQTNNFGKGGRGQDRILVSVQDDSAMNNADFGTPSRVRSSFQSLSVGPSDTKQWPVR